jgi:hypothetical protein
MVVSLGIYMNSNIFLAMVNTIIQANDCLFQIKINDEYVSVLCGKSFTVTINTDEKETTTVTDGAYKSFDYKVLSYTANINGAMRIPDATTTTTFDFVAFQQAFYEVPFRAVWIDPAGAVRTFTGNGIIKTNNLVASSSQIADGTVDILGTGPFEIGDTLDEFVSLTLVCTGNNDAPAFIKFWLLNEDGDTIFQTDTLAEASGSMLDNPLNITVPVPHGTWYFYYYVDTNTIGNTIAVNAPPTYAAGFNNNVTQFNTYPDTLYDFTADRTVTITLGIDTPPPTCVPVSIPGSPVLEDGEQFTPWATSFALAGSQPFNLTNITKPSWMTIELYTPTGGSTYVMFSGTPDVTGTGIEVSFNVNNACGTVAFSQTIDVVTNPDACPIVWAYGEASGSTTSFRIFVNGALYISTDVPDGGNFSVPPGTSMEVFVYGAPFDTKALDVDDITASTELFNNTSAVSSIDFAWTTTAGHTYDINGEGIE